MIKNPDLQAISVGGATVEEAAHALEDALKGDASAEAIYRALCDWTWKALHSRRLDDGLAEWLGLIEGVRARLPRQREDTRARLGVLADLVGTSVRFAASVSEDELLRYSHVPDILRFVASRNGRVSRQSLRAEFGFGDPRLSQLLTLLVHNGLLDREPRGREAHFALTSRGVDLLERIRRKPAAVHKGTVGRTPVRRPRQFEGSMIARDATHGTSDAGFTTAGAGEVAVTKPARHDRFVPRTKLLGEVERAEDRRSFPLPVGHVVSKDAHLEGK